MAKDEDKELRKVFEQYEKLLFKAANSAQSETTYGYKAEFFKKIDEAAEAFKVSARRFVDKDIPDADLSSHAEEVLRRAGAFHETANVKLTTYVQMVAKLTASAEEFKGRIQARIDEDEKQGGTTTVSDLSDYINDELKSGRGATVRYSNGAEMPTEKYAAMLSRTTRMETQNLSMIGKAIDDGNDLVECSTISPTCPTCAMYQGRIYSISGNTPGYPALYETAFKHGYSVIHPNCRHQFFPYDTRFHSAEEIAQLEENTRQPFDGDPQSESVRAVYARTQMQMRQWNKELNEFAEMRKFYAERGEEAPYKTLGAFRRAYRSEQASIGYAKSHFMRRDARHYAEYESVLGKDKMPQTLAEFQQMKYNEERRFDLLRQYRESVANGKVTNIGFIPFEAVMKEATQKIVGITTSTGVKVEAISYHLIERIIGSEKEKRLGISIDKVIDTLENGYCDGEIKFNKEGKPSVKFNGDGCSTTFNPDENKVVQCNPKKRGKKG